MRLLVVLFLVTIVVVGCGKQNTDKPTFSDDQNTVTAPSFDTNDYLDQALEDLETVRE